MNSKANRVQVKWPPLLNLSKDRPHVDNTWQNFERVNGPYLNDMVNPLYLRNNNYKAVYDKQGNEYRLNNNTLTKNGTTLLSGYSAGIKREEVEQVPNCIAFAVYGSDVYQVAYENNKFIMYKNGIQTATYALNNASIIEARLSFPNTYGVFVACYRNSNNGFVLHIFDINLASRWQSSTWCNQLVMGASSTVAEPSAVRYSGEPLCINIGYRNGVYGVSVTKKPGKVIEMTASSVGFITVIWNGTFSNMKQIKSTFLPTRTSASKLFSYSVDYEVINSFSYSSVTTATKSIAVRSNGERYYYSSGATKINQLTKCTRTFPMHSSNLIGQQVQIDVSSTDTPVLESFNVYQVTEYSQVITNTLKGPSTLGMGSMVSSLYLNTSPYGNYFFETVNASSVSFDFNLVTFSQGNFNWTGEISSSVRCIWYSGAVTPNFTPRNTTVNIDDNEYDGSRTLTLGVNTVTLAGQWNTESYTMGVLPVIMLDSGYMYPLFFMYPISTAQITGQSIGSYMYSVNGNYVIPGHCTPAYDGTTLTMTIHSNMVCGSTIRVFRSGSFVIDQNNFEMTLKFSNSSAINPVNLMLDDTITYNGSGRFLEMNFRCNSFRYAPGTSRLSSFNYTSNAVYNDPSLGGPNEDLLVFTVGGSYSNQGNFRLLYNTYSSGYTGITGISAQNSANAEGTLLTAWNSIDNNNYVSISGNNCIYKDVSGTLYKFSEKPAELFTILEDRVIVVNTRTWLNAYDSEQQRLFHYASDYNGRIRFGTTTQVAFNEAIRTGSTQYTAYPYIRYTGDAVNPLYEVQPRRLESSLMLPAVPRYRCNISSITIPAMTTPKDDMGVDIFYSNEGSTAAIYRLTYIYGTTIGKHNLSGLYYPTLSSSSPNQNPSLFAEYINGAGNNDMIVEGKSAYVLNYYDGTPTLVYNSNTIVTNLYDNKTEFFVIQGQFYGIIGTKLYSLMYSDGSISAMDAIIDLGDLQFIGNNPMIAFFYDSATRVIRSFTGDANLQTLYPSTKITDYKGLHWYDETTQSIFAATNAGLLVIGDKNVYLLENFKNTTLCQFDINGITHITDNGMTYSMKYYESDGYVVNPLQLETSFWGLGSNELTTIDRWNVTLYDLNGTHPESYIKVGVRSLNDVTVKSEEKTIKITPDMYDKWSNSILISYNPKLIKGQGIRLYLETPLTVQKIVPHIMDDGTGVVTGKNRSI